jgi:hypothetical protein
MKKIIIVCAYMEIGTTTLTSEDVAENLLSEPITYRIKDRPFLEDYKPTKTELQQLPQKIKHRKKRPFHN